MVRWKSLQFKVLPVEIIFVIYMFVDMFHPRIYQQLFFQRLAEDTLSKNPNYTAATEDSPVCLNQDIIVNYTDNATFEHVQYSANQLNMYCEVISLATSSVVSLIYGPLSDIVGRKPIFFAVFTGFLLAALMQAAIIIFRLNLYYNLLSVALYGLGGGYATMTGITFASVSDVTSKKWVATRMGVVESGVAVGNVLGYLIGYNWLQSDRCNFLPPGLLLVATVVLGLLYLLVFPEPLSHEIHSDQRDNETRGFKKLVNGVKLFFVPSYNGFSNWWRIWVVSLIICFESLCEVGGGEILDYFLHNKPLEWSYRLIGYYGAYFNILNALSLVVVYPLLLASGLSKYIVMLLPIVFAVVCNIVIASIKWTWEMFAVGGLLSVRDIGFPILRSMLAFHVSPQDYGSVLTMSSMLETVASSGSSVLFNEVYHPEAVVKGHTVNAGIIFWITAGVWALNIPLVLLLWFCKSKKKVKTVQLFDEKTLLSSGSQDYGTTAINRN